jgi:glucosamine-6-phosphate deaminase
MLSLLQVNRLNVAVFQSNEALGQAAAADFSSIVRRSVDENGSASVILATGNSQLTFLQALRDREDVPWRQVTIFHMDEYLGIADMHSASFRRYIREHVTEVFQPLAVYGIQGDAPDIDGELRRYAALLAAHQPILCVMGIGENGHLAFNDPPADFHTRETIHVVTLDATCRQQQVGEGHFASITDVPKQAISLTIPALLKPSHVMVLAPEARKARIVKAALYGPVTEACPASVLQFQANATLYLDQDSASLLDL